MRLWLVLLFTLLGLPVLAQGQAPNDQDRVIDQFCEYTLEQSTVNPQQVTGYLAGLREDGSWADIDYGSQQLAVWAPAVHVSRMQQMAIAWRRGEVKDTAPDALLAAIHRAFAHWRQQDYQCPNWWFNQIGIPQILFTTALILGDALQPDECSYLTQTVLPRVKIGMTGQNRVWLAGNTLMGGLLLRDRALVGTAAEAIFAEVVVTGKEGIQPDYSFHQHGAQQQFGNYGLSFADDTTRWAAMLHGTPWAMPQQELQIIRRYLLDGSSWVLWRGQMDISACGRQLTPNSPASKSRTMQRILKLMPRIDPEQADAYTAAVRRNAPGAPNDLIGNRYYWRSDYLIHRRSDFYLTVKLSSERVIGVESLNSENLSGYYLADGACYLYRSGGEYTGILPAWNWRQVPGVTCPQEAGPLPAFSKSSLPTAWVGGISDGRNGGVAVEYTRVQDAARRFSAKKAWFCFDDQVVCLGAGIEATDAVTAPLLTTINQCLLHGPVRVNDGGLVRAMEPGTLRLEAPAWVEHDGVRYRFLTSQQTVVSAGPRTGNWRAVLQTGNVPREDITLNVFHLAVEHGHHPGDGHYAYIIQPVDPERQPDVELLQNTPGLQAACVGTQLQAAFYAPGALTYGGGHTVSVDAPCLLLLDTAAHRAYVSDPLRQRTTLTLTLDGNAYNISLPQADFKGQPQMVEVKK